MLQHKPMTPEKMELMRAKEHAKKLLKQERLLAKVNSDEYKEEQKKKTQAKYEKQALKLKEKRKEGHIFPTKNLASQKPKLVLVQNPEPDKLAKKKVKSRGMKGRAPTAEEKYYLEKIGALSCISCLLMGKETYPITPHHTDGRTKKWAHAKCLPLCAHHHDVPLDVASRIIFPLMIPFHAKGSFGGKASFEAVFGTQDELLQKVYVLIGEKMPWLE